MLGQRVNNFEIVRLLGEGGMGAVYEAEHLLIRKKVAVKVLKPELGKDAELLQRFFNEARATSAIRHPNIVEVIDLGFLPDGMPYLVMELLEGESLAERIDHQGKLPIGTALDFITQTASALQAAHDNGIVHRDLKPDNLYLVRDQRFRERELVKVLDFGIAKLHGDQSPSRVDTVAGTIWGTPPYMSPEQCRGLPSQIGHRTDIYALGVILYEALAGEPPFVGEGLGDTMMLHMGASVPPIADKVADVPPHVERAILKALEKKPEARFASMAEFSAALHGADASVVTLPRQTPSEATRAFDDRRGGEGAVVPLPRGSAPAGSFSAARPLASGAAPADAALPAADGAEHEITRRQWKAAPPELLPLPLAAESPENAPAEAVPEKVADEGSHGPRNALVIAAAVGLAALAAVMLPRRSETASPERTDVHAARGPEPAPVVRHANDPAASVPAPAAAGAPLIVAPNAAEPGRGATDPTSRAPAASARASSTPASKAQKMRHAGASASAASSSTRTPAPDPTAPAPAVAVAPAPAAPSSTTPNAAPGYLSLDSEPWANVSLGGKQLGSTPLMRVPLPPGKHVLTLTNPELGASTSYTVEVKSGETVSRLVGWRKQ